MKRSALLAAAIVMLACGSPLEGDLARPPLPRGADQYRPDDQQHDPLRAGAAAIDITPPPGHALAGHATDGAFALGVWTRLQARALAFEDARGVPLVLVSADLWAIGGGLSDRVAELVAADPRGGGIGREHIVLAATNTHHAPGNVFTSRVYNLLSTRRAGFDPELFEFLAERIAEVILRAATARRPARLLRRDVAVPTLARNRSLPAFVANPEARALLDAQASLPGCLESILDEQAAPSDDPCHAVDPILTTLEVLEAQSPGRRIAVAGFFAVHGSAMPARTELYHGDLFATAATRTRARLVSYGEQAPVVALFNGAQGDVSPNWDEQGRAATTRLGYALGEAIATSLQSPGVELRGSIGVSHSMTALADVDTSAGRTARRALYGVGSLGGPEDGRTRYFRRGFVEGKVRRRSRPGHGTKRAAFGYAPQALTHPKRQFPSVVPLTVASLGPMVFATIPGEATTVLGRRIATRVGAARRTRSRVVVVGLASAYAHDFTTPEEYVLQHYEGASTLYGTTSGVAIADELERLAKVPWRPETTRYVYAPGPQIHWDGRERSNWAERLDGAAVRLLGDLDLLAGRPYVTFSFLDARPPWPLGGPDLSATPRIAIRHGGAALSIEGITVDDETDEFALWLTGIEDDAWAWDATWMAPRGVDPQSPLQFEVQPVGGTIICSKPFSVADVYASGHIELLETAPCEN